MYISFNIQEKAAANNSRENLTALVLRLSVFETHITPD